jgi:hypothetical protein
VIDLADAPAIFIFSEIRGQYQETIWDLIAEFGSEESFDQQSSSQLDQRPAPVPIRKLTRGWEVYRARKEQRKNGCFAIIR